jgi:Carboxypeptidase regulatory-like domain
MIRLSSLRLALASLALLLAFGSQMSGALAGTSGGIAGVVSDSKTGAPIPDVKLQIASPSQTVTTQTDSHGHFIVFSLQPDNYTLTAEKNGYEAESVTGEPVYADQTQRYNLTLTATSDLPQ